MNGYSPVQFLGSGSYSSVKEYRKKGEEKTFAFKFLKKKECLFFSGLIEIDIMRRFNHPHLMSLQEVIIEDESLIIRMEKGYPLINFMNENKVKTFETRLRLFYQIASAIYFLHRNGIYHGDLKPENILIVNDKAVVIDFSLSGFLHYQPNYFCSFEYRAPEFISFDPKRRPDIGEMWSLGCMLYYLLTSKNYDRNDEDLCDIYQYYEGVIQKDVIDNICSLLSLLLQKDPSKRGSFKDIFSNNIFTKPVSGKVSSHEVICPSLKREDLSSLIEILPDKLQPPCIFKAIDLFYQSFHLLKDHSQEGRKKHALLILSIVSNLYEGNNYVDIPNKKSYLPLLIDLLHIDLTRPTIYDFASIRDKEKILNIMFDPNLYLSKTPQQHAKSLNEISVC